MTGWEKWHDWNAVVMRPMTAWFCDATGAAPGQTILDAACGTGLPSLELAARVRPTGKVIAIDVSGDMVDAARRKAAAAGAGDIEHRVMDLAALDFPDRSFDAVSCSFGLMFCPDPVRAARELVRVLRPGGRLAIAVWDQPGHCPFFTTAFQPVTRFVATPPRDPLAPGPFRLSSPGTLEAVLAEAGAADVAIESRQIWFDLDSVSMHWEVVRDMAAPVGAAAAKLGPAELEQLKQAIAEAIAPYTAADGRVRIPNVARCATGSTAASR